MTYTREQIREQASFHERHGDATEQATAAMLRQLLGENDKLEQQRDEWKAQRDREQAACEKAEKERDEARTRLATAQQASQDWKITAERFKAEADKLAGLLEVLSNETNAIIRGEYGEDWADDFGPLFKILEEAKAALAARKGD